MKTAARKHRTRNTPVLTLAKQPPATSRDPVRSIAYQCATDGGENAQIHRILEPGNSPNDPGAWDPVVSVFFALPGLGQLHPDDNRRGTVGDGWLFVRWSQVNTLIEGLLDARDAAVRTGMLPPPMTDADYLRRVNALDVAAGRRASYSEESIAAASRGG